ncbi:MAG: glutamate-1-semialdehyde 2,1-aminomutase [Chloroflexi bacterium]|nr:glutamate-1-semialdehyde 2,1-aminomutase [Chloroflexota bacterium]MBI3741454.1 glutamate-1-semialdehyde 2,1-aminomutase [Chloroflexota bacterium]
MQTQISKHLFETAQNIFPGGVNSPVRAWKSVGGAPRFIARGAGAKIFDADGNEYLDYVGSWGPLILGHAHPRVVAAIQDAATRGTSYGAPCELEIELDKRITQSIPSMEMLRFVSSGTEATMSAIRLARAFTHRDKIVKFDGGYHGHADFLLAKAGSGVATLGLPDSAGVPAAIAATTLIAPYNDLDSVARLFDSHRDEIAAVIVEPVAGNMGVVSPQKNFLSGLREMTRAHNSLLIFDEVITGFRVAWGGAQSLYNIQPDLTCLGKIIGGGLPVGAYGGRRDIMRLIAPLGPVYQAGTLSGNPLAMAAGIATLDAIAAIPNAYAQLDARGAQLEQGLCDGARAAKIPLIINRVGSMMTVFFTELPITNYQFAKTSDMQRYAKFFHGMLERAIYLAPSQFEAMFISLAHTEQDILRTVESVDDALKTLNK